MRHWFPLQDSSACRHLGRTLPKTFPSCYQLPRPAPWQEPSRAAWHALPRQRGMDLGTVVQAKGEGWCWLWMLNKQFFLTTNPVACSAHVVAHDGLVSPKHDQAISAAVSLHLSSNGGSLSICLLLKSKRSIGLCIFSLMNSLFPTFSFFLLLFSFLRPELSQKAKWLFLVFSPLCEDFFFSLFLGRCQKMWHWLICFKQHFSILLDLCILDSKQSQHLAYLFIYVVTSFN